MLVPICRKKSRVLNLLLHMSFFDPHILAFHGHCDPLSNFYWCENEIPCPNDATVQFSTVEHIYVYEMALFHGRKDICDEVVAAKKEHAATIKRSAKNQDWNAARKNIMEMALLNKADASPSFVKRLLLSDEKTLAHSISYEN